MTSAVLGPGVTVVCAVVLVLVVSNLVAVRRPPSRRWPADAPLVSVCIPARDEEHAIARCLASVLDQNYPCLEILVLDDRSTDSTAEVVAAVQDPRVRLLSGRRLPEGWTGKNWACHQLAEAASGEVLCFLDADTVLAPTAVADTMGVLDDSGAGLVTMLLAAEHRSAGEGVLLPMVNHALLALFPVTLMHRLSSPVVALALGPFLLVTRTAYDDSGGHAAAPGHIVDDVTLCRAVKSTGAPVRLVNGTRLATTRWYDSVGGIWRGFSKNAYGALDYNPVLALAVVAVLVPLLLAPFVHLAVGLVSGDVAGYAVVQVAVLLAVRLVTSVLGDDPVWSVPTHPVAVAFWGCTLAWSVALTVSGRSVEWRGRQVTVRSDTG